MTSNESASASAFNVMERHLQALNALNENDLAATLHFPHYRLVGTKLECWPTKDQYLIDFKARAGDNWAKLNGNLSPFKRVLTRFTLR